MCGKMMQDVGEGNTLVTIHSNLALSFYKIQRDILVILLDFYRSPNLSHDNFVFLFHYRLVRNPLGSAHPEATLKACIEHGAPDDAIQAAKAEFHAYLAANRSAQAASSHDLVEDSELLSEDREMDSDSQGINTKRRNVFSIKYQ